jgi:hypothetical protein
VALSPAQFKVANAEFANFGDSLVQAKLDFAYQITGPSWGELRDLGASLYAAHLISLSPLAEPSSRSVKEGSRTSYLEEWERLLRMTRVFATTTNAVTP